jgi:hypothetical protein
MQTPTSPPRKSRLIQKKRVRFADTSTLVVMQPKSIKDMNASWYTKAEMTQFRQEAFRAARSLKKSKPSVVEEYINQSLETKQSHPKDHDFSGIEKVCGIEHFLSPKVMKILESAREATIACVLQEQDRQDITSECNPDLIAEVSESMSLFTRLWRHRIAVLNYAD